MHRQVGSNGRVVAFEPQPELATYLHDLRSSFGLKQLEIVESGLSSQAGELTLRRPKGHWGGASFSRFHDRTDDLDLIKTPVTTLDSFFANNSGQPVSFIKCDVEGHEYEVFRGAAKILTEDRPELLFECANKDTPHVPVFTYLTSLGYEGYCFYRDGFAPVSEYRALFSQLDKRALRDFVFVPKEKTRGLLRRSA
jgi:FkbM family methyltransferase